MEGGGVLLHLGLQKPPPGFLRAVSKWPCHKTPPGGFCSAGLGSAWPTEQPEAWGGGNIDNRKVFLVVLDGFLRNASKTISFPQVL